MRPQYDEHSGKTPAARAAEGAANSAGSAPPRSPATTSSPDPASPTGDYDEGGTRWGMYDARDQLSGWPRGVMALRGRGSYLQLVASPGVV